MRFCFRKMNVSAHAANVDASIEVQSVQESHWADLKLLRLASLQDAPKAFGMSYASALAMTEAQWRERAAGTRAKFLIARQGERAVGLIGITPVMDGDCELIAMWVHPSQRGTGAAALLVDAVKQAAVLAGATMVHLAVSPENRPAARFYEKQGFVFLQEFETLDSDPSVTLQKMAWRAPLVQHRAASALGS